MAIIPSVPTIPTSFVLLRAVPKLYPIELDDAVTGEHSSAASASASPSLKGTSASIASNRVTPLVVLTALLGRRIRRGRHARQRIQRAAGTELDVQTDISVRPSRRIAKELSKFEDPDFPIRPQAPMRDRQGLWAPPGPQAISAPEILVIGLGRRLREAKGDSARSRLGAGAVEALQQRYQIATHFDADAKGYMGTCRASLDKSGRAGVQKIHLFQPVVDGKNNVASAISELMERPKFAQATVLFVLSDHRLPFGQLRMRSSYDTEDRRLRSAFAALGPENRVTCLYIGAGWAPQNQELLAAEVGALPRILGNAATAIEVWLSEADLGLVMRFVNRPEVYEMPPGWPYSDNVLKAGEQSHDSPEEALQSYNQGSLIGPSPGDEFALFDLNRNKATQLPDVSLAPMSPNVALAALGPRPAGSEKIILAGRRYPSLAKLRAAMVNVLLEQGPGQHLRFEDDELAVKALMSFHPDGDRLLEDLVAVKVDCSPIDDDTRCFWVVKYDGYEEDVSLKACLEGLENYLQLNPPKPAQGSVALAVNDAVGSRRPTLPRLGPGRWTQGLRESTFERATFEEEQSKMADK